MVSLRSFGVPYLAGMAPFTARDQKDILVRVPWWAMKTRGELFGYKDWQRQGSNLKPRVPADSRAKDEAEQQGDGGADAGEG